MNRDDHPHKESNSMDKLQRFLALHEFELEARNTLPHAVYEYIAGGAGDERSIRANEESYQEIFLRPLLRSVAGPELGQDLFDTPLPPQCCSPRLPTSDSSILKENSVRCEVPPFTTCPLS